MAETAKVLKKLKDHPAHKKKPIRELEQLAIELTSPEKIKERFAHLLQDGYRMAADIVDEDETDLLHTLEYEAHHERVKHDTSKACHLPVKLAMQKLQITPPFANSFAKKLKFEYGALHVALIVGDVVIEWGREELVEPRIQPNFMSEFLANVGDQGEWHEREGQYQADMSLANRQRDRERKLDIVCEAIENKALLIDKLVEVIVEYNCNKTYSVFHCNCQDFAREALATLGIKKPIEFNGKLRERFEALKKGNRKVHDPQLQSHENLDLYVEGVKNDPELGLQDLEYLQCLYFAEHLPKMENSGDSDNWECGVPTCKSAELDKLIEQKSLPHKRLLVRDTTNSQTPLQLQYRSQAQGTDLATAGPNHYTLQAPSGHQQSTQPNETDIIRASTTPPATNKDHAQQGRDSNATHVKGPRKKCPTADCEFYGTQETCFYCSKCFEVNNAPKCDDCDEFFGSSEYNGLCYECLLKRTRSDKHIPPTNNLPATRSQNQAAAPARQVPLQQPTNVTQDRDKCYECKLYFANEEYHGLCHSCMMSKTRIESEGLNSAHQKRPPVLSKPSQQPQSPHYTPTYEKCRNHQCNNYETETGYCDVCNHSLSLTPNTVRGECYLCTGSDLRDENEMCLEHKKIIMRKMKEMGNFNDPQPQVHATYQQEPRSTHSNYENIIPIPPSNSDSGAPQTQANTTHTTGQHHIWPQQYDHGPARN